MANLTISVDADVLKKARLRAIEQNTSVEDVVREYLESYADVARQRQRAVDELFEIAVNAKASSGGRRWTRDELHER